jgi:two-component system nitrogen regulation response regulator NtrX
MLPPEILDSNVQADSRISAMMSVPLREARENFEREYLKVQISRFSGNISKTASYIGMERSALHRKLKLLGMSERKGEDEGEEE